MKITLEISEDNIVFKVQWKTDLLSSKQNWQIFFFVSVFRRRCYTLLCKRIHSGSFDYIWKRKKFEKNLKKIFKKFWDFLIFFVSMTMTGEISTTPTTTSTATRTEDGGRFSKSMKVLGVEFAPVYIPFERRLQTLAVFTW